MALPVALVVQGTVAMAGIVIVLAVGAALGIEGCPDLAHLGAQAFQHVDDDMVVADQDAALVDLRRQVAVAEMPGETRDGGGVAAAHLDQVLLGGAHLDEAALLQPEAIAAVQHDGLDEIEQEVEAAVAQHAQAAAVAIVEQERDGVAALARRPVAGADDFGGAFHGYELAVIPRPQAEGPLRISKGPSLRSG